MLSTTLPPLPKEKEDWTESRIGSLACYPLHYHPYPKEKEDWTESRIGSLACYPLHYRPSRKKRKIGQRAGLVVWHVIHYTTHPPPERKGRLDREQSQSALALLYIKYYIGVGRGGPGGQAPPPPPNNLRGGANIPFGPPNNASTCTGKTIPLNSILEFSIISCFKMRNVIIWH